MHKFNFYRNPICLLILLFFLSCNKQDDLQPNEEVINTVNKEFAEKLASRFSNQILENSFKPSNSLTREGNLFPYREREIVNSYTIEDKNGIPALYIFNYASDSGFVIISADFRHEPICAFVDNGNITPEQTDVPSAILDWFDVTVENIEALREERYDNTQRANNAWYYLLQETDLFNEVEVADGSGGFRRMEPAVPSGPTGGPDGGCSGGYSYIKGPLLTTAWGQRCTFNTNIPAAGCNNLCTNQNQNALTGCVATAMGQILRYWQNQNSFNYDYANMPNDRGNLEVARMMRDAANSVGFSPGCLGTFSSFNDIHTSFKNNFGYSSASSPQIYVKGSSDATIQAELRANRPIILSGYRVASTKFLWWGDPASDGHAWICDGYWSTSDGCFGYLYYHMNWGWQQPLTGQPNFIGYYAYNNWNVNGQNFQHDIRYIKDIHP